MAGGGWDGRGDGCEGGMLPLRMNRGPGSCRNGGLHFTGAGSRAREGPEGKSWDFLPWELGDLDLNQGEGGLAGGEDGS